MDVVIMGLALAFNIVVILWKWNNRTKTDAIVDALLLAVVMYMAGQTLTGMLVGTVASFTVSIYLLFNPTKPIKLPKFRPICIRLPKFKLPKFTWRFRHA